MSCSGHHFSVHSPDCKAHLSIQSNRPIQVEALDGDSRISTPLPQKSTASPSASQQQVVAYSQAMLQIQTLNAGDCARAAVSPPPHGQPLVSSIQQGGPDGDQNYTLVVLDCSPHPSGDERGASQLGNVSSCHGSPCGDCRLGCHSRTELIVRQHIDHDHFCQHQTSGRLSARQQQPAQPGGDATFMTDWSASQATNLTATRASQERASSSQAPRNQHSSATFSPTGTSSTSPRRRHEHQTETHENHLEVETRREERQTSYSDQRRHEQPVQVHIQTTTSSEGGRGSPADCSPSPGRKQEPGTRLVKRWNWNQAQFVEEQVPDRPQPPQRSSSNAASRSVAASQTQQLQQAAGRLRQPDGQSDSLDRSADVWTREIQSICSELSPVPPAQHFDPSWLAYRKPDEASVQADPLYRDLMFELQRLEEGVSQQLARQPEPMATPDCLQKPVFGQPLRPDEVELQEYDNIEFIGRLIPNSDASLRIEWTKNGRPLMESSRLTCEFEFDVVRLVVRRCEAEDSGIYQCRAVNSLGEAVSRAKLLVHAKGLVQCESLHPAGLARIQALENPPPASQREEHQQPQAPKFLSHIRDYVEKDEGESVHFECCLAPVDDPEVRTEWFFNGRPLVTGSRFHTIDDFGFIVLDIDWLFPRDTGEYICRATNRQGSDLTRTVLRVRPAKSIILDSQLDNADATIDKLRQLELPDVQQPRPAALVDAPAHFVQPLRAADNRRHFLEGDNVHFEARAGPATDGQLTVEWFHNDKPLISGHRFKPTFDFGHILLDILYVYPEDSGVYKCVARNAQGEAASELQIEVAGKQAIVYQSQLPKEMLGGVDKITEMEAMWNRAPDPEEEEAPAERLAPQFVLEPKPCAAFEGSCARFCCRILANPRPRVQWFINGQLVVSGSRHKLTHDGMYHLIIPKCQPGDAGAVEVRAKNLLGECAAQTRLAVKRKVDDYRGVLKNSPNPWYDEQTLKVYRRQRKQDAKAGPAEDDAEDDADAEGEDFEEFVQNFQRQRQLEQLKLAAPQQPQAASGLANQLVGYMEPGTPDVNLLLSSFQQQQHPGVQQPPLVEPGDLHPVVIEQQAIMAPAPSTIQRALQTSAEMADQTSAPRTSCFSTPDNQQQHSQSQLANLRQQQEGASQSGTADQQQRRVFGLTKRNANHGLGEQQAGRPLAGAAQQQAPENVEHGKEVHSHFHTQLQVERRPNQEITREIIEKETFEQEHRGFSKDNLTSVSVASSMAADNQRLQDGQLRARSLTPIRLSGSELPQLLTDDQPMVPPEFVQKIQPCQAIEGDDARFECQFRGEPLPAISWYRANKLLKASNLYAIETDLAQSRSTLTIRRVTLSGNAVYTVKAENAAGSAKSSANLVVEAHPLPQASRGGHARPFDALDHLTDSRSSSVDFRGGGPNLAGFSSPTVSDYDDSLPSETFLKSGGGGGGGGWWGQTQAQALDQQQQKVIKSVRTRRMSPDEMTSLIRASPSNLIAPTFLHTCHEVHAKLGELARLDARLIGSQPMEVRWLKDGQRVRADKQHKLLLEGDLYTLLILECAAQDEGHYECVASNQVGDARCGASLRVTQEGRQSSASFTSSVPSAGQQTKLAQHNQMISSGLSDGRGSWSASASAATVTSSSSSFAAAGTGAPSGQSQGSTFNSISQAAAGLQQQVASSQAHQQQQSAHSNQGPGQRQHFGLTKQPHHSLMSQYTTASYQQQQLQTPAAIPKLIKGLENQLVREGKSVTLRCQISAFPQAEVAWFRDGDKPIKPSKYFRIFKDNDETYCLKILETFPEDQGQYKCVASNQNGQVETSAVVSFRADSPAQAGGEHLGPVGSG